MSGSAIFYTYADNTMTISGVSGSPTESWFTVKQYPVQLDSEALIQITQTGSLVYVNGLDVSGSPGGVTNTDGTLVVSGDSAVVTLKAAAAPKIYGNTWVDFVGELKTKGTVGSSASVVSVVEQFVVRVMPSLGRSI